MNERGKNMNGENEFILEMKNCRKEFPGVVALDDVSLYVKRGEVHALMGENGAGKSTIMKILAGIYTLDGGEILMNGEPFVAKSPADALQKGISMIHQELEMLPDMTVEQNIFAGREKAGPCGVINRKKLVRQAQKILDDMNLDIDANTRVRDLSVAQMQMVEIAKATSVNAEIIIMDEPTSAIPDKEVEQLFEIIGRLKKQNKAIIYISHRLDEIFQITDMITVMRDGCLVGTKPTKDITREELVHMMVGRELKDMFVKESGREFGKNSDVVLKVEGLTREGEFEDVSFEVHRGEIFGISGLMGAGRTEVMETVFGMRSADAGEIYLNGNKVKIKTPKDAIRQGIAFITEDRKLYGLNLLGSIKTNITQAYMDQITKMSCIMDLKKEKGTVDSLMKTLRVKAPDRETIVNNLSGGNQQKVVIAKWLMGKPDVLIMDEPTRGIDVGAKAEIYQIMDSLAKEGKTIIMISSEMPELLGMSDRVVVLCNGRITGEFLRDECSQEKLMACASGEGGMN